MRLWPFARKQQSAPASATPAVVEHRIHAAAPRFGEGGQSRVAVVGYGKTWRNSDDGNLAEQAQGYCTTYTYWLQQVSELYQMLEARVPYGSEPCKTILGHRTSFLAGEGIRISAENDQLQDWIDGWLRDNGLTGRGLTDAVAESEVVGQVLFTVDDAGMAKCIPSFVGYEGWQGSFGIGPQQYTEGNWEQPEWWPQYDGMTLTGVHRLEGSQQYVPWLEVGAAGSRGRFVFIRTGGHGNVARYPAPTSRMAAMIDSMKNLDRSVRQMRRINNEATRQSPTFELPSDEGAADEHEIAEYYEGLQNSGWGPGDPVVTPGKFSIVASGVEPVEAMAREAAACTKALSATSGVPPHWLGHVDMMSNRATADSLFETIKSATLVERLSWEHGIDEMIRQARMVMGGPAGEFEVTMPLLSYHEFKERMEAFMLLRNGNIISHEDVQTQLPFRTQHDAEAAEAEAQQREMEMMQAKNGPTGVVPREDAG